jgi:hypothetical protein
MSSDGMIAAPSWLVGLATDLGITAALIASVVAILRSPLGRVVRWAWRRLVGDPVTDWAKASIESTVSPQIDKLRAENSQQHAAASAERAAQMQMLLARFEIVDRLAAVHEQRISALEQAKEEPA